MAKRKLDDKRRAYLRWNVAEARRKIKKKAVEYKGGACTKCGYNKSVAALIFHHTDPSQKEFGIAHGGISRNWEKVKIEIDKCVLLCANCHAEEHEIEDKKIQEEKYKELRKMIPCRPKGHGSIIKNCHTCNKEIKVYNSALSKNNFCSKECRFK